MHDEDEWRDRYIKGDIPRFYPFFKPLIGLIGYPWDIPWDVGGGIIPEIVDVHGEDSSAGRCYFGHLEGLLGIHRPLWGPAAPFGVAIVW